MSTPQPLPGGAPDSMGEAAAMDALVEPQVEMAESEAVVTSGMQTPVVIPEIPSDHGSEALVVVWPLVRYLEAFLGVAAIGAGMAALYLRRRGWA